MTATTPDIARRYDWLRDKPDGTLWLEPAGDHIVIVSKRGSQLFLTLVEQANPRSNFVQSCLDINEPLRLQLDYTQAMLLGLLWRPQAEQVASIGIGGGSLPLVLGHYLPQARLDCVDTSPAVIKAAQTYFGFRPGEQHHIYIQDGREFLKRTPRRYDLICLDVFQDKAFTPYHLVTTAFYELCRARLTAGGVLVVNVPRDAPYQAEKVATIAAVFPSVTMYPVSANTSIVYAGDEVAREQLAARAAHLGRTLSPPFPFEQHLARLEPVQRDVDAAVLRDGLPPAGYRPS